MKRRGMVVKRDRREEREKESKSRESKGGE